MYAIALDTGELRGNGDALFGRILEAEARRGVDQRLDMWTLQELLSHVADKGDKDYASARAAIRRAARRSLPENVEPKIIAPSEIQFARLIFQARLPDIEGSLDEMIRVARFIAAASPTDDLAEVQTTLQRVAMHVRDAEAHFANVFGSIRDQIEAAAYDVVEMGKSRSAWIKEYVRSPTALSIDAASIVRRTAKQVGLPIPDAIPTEMIDLVSRANRASSLAVGITFETILCDGANLGSDRIRNLMWDQEIASSLGKGIAGHPIRLVTSDRIFARAAMEAGFGDAVWGHDQYLQYLGVELNAPD